MTPVTKIRTGVVAEHRGKFWGVLHEDGHSRSEGWGPIEAATISDPKYCHRPEDMTYPNSHYLPELRKATLRPIRVETTYTVSSENTER